MPRATYQEFPFEEACSEIAVYPVEIEPSDQSDPFLTNPFKVVATVVTVSYGL